MDRTTHTEATNTAPTRTTVRSLFRWDRPIPTPRPHSAPGLRTVGSSTDSEPLSGHVSLVFPWAPLPREVAVSHEGAGGVPDDRSSRMKRAVAMHGLDRRHTHRPMEPSDETSSQQRTIA